MGAALRLAGSVVALMLCAGSAVGQSFHYVERVVVAEPTTLDWAYAATGVSPASPPALVEETKRGGAFSYEFYGPAERDGVARPLVIFASPQDRPVGWDFWAGTCAAHGALFAGVRDAGNGVSEARRIRAALETLADVRRRHSVRTDRTYLAGYSGGAHIAWRVACALPEQIGGVVCIGYAPEPPRSEWQRLRLAERLSVAIISGERDPATPWIEELHEPLLREYGVRTGSKILARRGHAMPPAKAMADAFEWLELAIEDRTGDVKRRVLLNRIGITTRDELSQSYFKEAQSRLKSPDSTAAGLALLTEIVRRWPDLPATGDAQQLLNEYEQQADKPWLAEQRERQLRVLRIEANGYERLARGNDPALRSQRTALTAHAKLRWEQLAEEGGARQRAEAKQRLAELEKWIARTPATDPNEAATPLNKVRFGLVGDVTLAEGVERFGEALAKLGYRLEVAEEAAAVITAGDERKIKLDMPAATYAEIDRRFFRRHGLKLVRQGNAVRLLPAEAASSK